jgi:hypothetical protein
MRRLLADGYTPYSENNDPDDEFIYQDLLQHFPWILGVLGVPPKEPYPPIGIDTPLSHAQIDIQYRKVSNKAIDAVRIIQGGKARKPRDRAIEVVLALSQGILMEDLHIEDDEELLRIINLAMAEND